MKLLASTFLSSSTSTISTSNSFDSKSTTASCLTGIMRRVLCSGTLPTYPSDHVTEDGNVSFKCFREFSVNEESKNSHETNPSLVARLMGLDSMPETNFRTSISRSRSMGSAYGEDSAIEARHRRVKSSASFREAPTFLELEDKDFFVLNFEDLSDGKEFRSTQRRRVKGVREEIKAASTTEKKMIEDLEEKRKVSSDLNGKEIPRKRNHINHNRRSRSRSNRRSTSSSDSDKVKDTTITISLVPKKISSLKHFVGAESVKPLKPKRCVKPGLEKKKKKVNSQAVKPPEPELNSEDSSPVSVLDCGGQFLVDPKGPISGCDSNSTTSSSRRKLSLETDDHVEGQNPRRDDNLIEKKEWKYVRSRKKESHISQENSNVVDVIWQLSESELLGASWVQRWTFDHEDFQGVGEEFERIILDQLLEELVDRFDCLK